MGLWGFGALGLWGFGALGFSALGLVQGLGLRAFGLDMFRGSGLGFLRVCGFFREHGSRSGPEESNARNPITRAQNRTPTPKPENAKQTNDL